MTSLSDDSRITSLFSNEGGWGRAQRAPRSCGWGLDARPSRLDPRHPNAEVVLDSSRRQRSNRPGGGFVLALVLVCLTVIVLALTAMLGRMSQGHRQAVERERYIKANWLAESAFERATAQLQRDSAYRGEPWRIESDQLAGRTAADIVIEIETPNSSSSLPATVRITVRDPNSSKQVIQKAKQLIVPVPEGGETP